MEAAIASMECGWRVVSTSPLQCTDTHTKKQMVRAFPLAYINPGRPNGAADINYTLKQGGHRGHKGTPSETESHSKKGVFLLSEQLENIY